MNRRMDRHLRPALLGRLCRKVDLNRFLNDTNLWNICGTRTLNATTRVWSEMYLYKQTWLHRWQLWAETRPSWKCCESHGQPLCAVSLHVVGPHLHITNSAHSLLRGSMASSKTALVHNLNAVIQLTGHQARQSHMQVKRIHWLYGHCQVNLTYWCPFSFVCGLVM